MKIKAHIFVLLLAISLANVSAATLDRRSLQGYWEAPVPGGFLAYIKSVFSRPERDSLEIKGDRNITLTRAASASGQILRSVPGGVVFHDDVMIAELREGGLRAKLVVSGWESGSSKRLFGMLFLYDSSGLLNGIPVSYDKVR